MIVFGLVLFLSYLLGRTLSGDSQTNNMLAVIGGIGFSTLAYGIYLLLANRKDIKFEYSDEYKIYRAKEEQRKQKQKLDSDDILRKYQTMPDLHLKDGSES